MIPSGILLLTLKPEASLTQVSVGWVLLFAPDEGLDRSTGFFGFLKLVAQINLQNNHAPATTGSAAGFSLFCPNPFF